MGRIKRSFEDPEVKRDRIQRLKSINPAVSNRARRIAGFSKKKADGLYPGDPGYYGDEFENLGYAGPEARVGDRVVLNIEWNEASISPGDTGTIVRRSDENPDLYEIDVDNKQPILVNRTDFSIPDRNQEDDVSDLNDLYKNSRKKKAAPSKEELNGLVNSILEGESEQDDVSSISNDLKEQRQQENQALDSGNFDSYSEASTKRAELESKLKQALVKKALDDQDQSMKRKNDVYTKAQDELGNDPSVDQDHLQQAVSDTVDLEGESNTTLEDEDAMDHVKFLLNKSDQNTTMAFVKNLHEPLSCPACKESVNRDENPLYMKCASGHRARLTLKPVFSKKSATITTVKGSKRSLAMGTDEANDFGLELEQKYPNLNEPSQLVGYFRDILNSDYYGDEDKLNIIRGTVELKLH